MYRSGNEGTAGGSDAPPKQVCNYVRPTSTFVGPSLLAYTKGLVQDGKYLYMKDLLDLDSHRPLKDVSHLVMSPEVCSPLVASAWEEELSSHPDKCFVEFILQGIQRGFRIGFDRRKWLVPATSNLSVNNPQTVTEYLSKEVALGRMWTILAGKWPKGLQTSPLGLIPKKNRPGKWHLIVDLSSPENKSVNSGINQEVASLAYASLDHLAGLVVSAGRGSFLVKADIKEAYRIVPVHPEDQHLLGVYWEGSLYVDKVLPFGLRSAPKIFSALADALQWILHRNGISKGLHYLDDISWLLKTTS